MRGGSGERSVLRVLDKREPVLAALCEDSLAKPDLVEELTVSRSTVDRAIRDLETHDLVARTDGGYRGTLAGRVLLSARREYVDQVVETAGIGDLVAHLPADAEVPVETFATAEAYRPETTNPHRPTTFLRDLAARTVHHRGVLVRQATPNAPAVIRERALAGSTDVEYLISPAMRDYLWTERPVLVTDLVEDGGVEFYEVTALPFDYGILTTPEEANFVVVVYDDRGTLQGVLHSTDERAVRWAEETYREHLPDATPLDPPVDR